MRFTKASPSAALWRRAGTTGINQSSLALPNLDLLTLPIGALAGEVRRAAREAVGVGQDAVEGGVDLDEARVTALLARGLAVNVVADTDVAASIAAITDIRGRVHVEVGKAALPITIRTLSHEHMLLSR